MSLVIRRSRVTLRQEFWEEQGCRDVRNTMSGRRHMTLRMEGILCCEDLGAS